MSGVKCLLALPKSVVSATVAFPCFSRQVILPADRPFVSALWDVLTMRLVPSTLFATVQFMLLHMPPHNGISM